MSIEAKEREYEMPHVRTYTVIDGPGNGNPNSPISLQKRLEAGEFELPVLNEAVERITSGEFLIPARAEAIETCGDGRSAKDQDAARAQMFGGTPALAKDDQLAETNVFGQAQDNLLSRMATLIDWRQQQELPTGNHQDDHAEGEKSGCGEQDGAPAAYAKIVESGEDVLGVVNAVAELIDRPAVTEDSYTAIADSARKALESGLLPTGAAVRDLVIDKAGEDAIEELTDQHNELIYIISLIPGYTFDRERFRQEYGQYGIDAFNEDQVVIDQELQRMADSDDSYRKLSNANLVRRIATAMNLTKNDLKIVVLK